MNLTDRPIFDKGSKPQKSPIIRKAARNQHCMLHIPGVCRQHPDYTVGGHLRLFGIAGMAEKPDDLFVIDVCDLCHAILDNRDMWADCPLGWDDILRALMFTQRNRRASGLILLPGDARWPA